MFLALAAASFSSRAQTNYEIQVYGAETVPPETLMVELHSNYTFDGQKYAVDGVYPTDHQEHETLELTKVSTSGRRSVSTSSPASRTGTECNGWAITSGLVSGSRIPGDGPSG